MTAKIRLSQCMIVKNEEKNIKRALSWGKKIMYEQIVVDTGSTDRTAEIAKQMGAKVFSFTWKDDFSAAKNYALSQATGDWVAFLDADEFFQEADVPKILPKLKAVMLQNVDVLRAKCIHIDGDGNILGAAYQERIFRNKPEIRYRYRVHEALYHTKGESLQVEDLQNDWMILHTGYDPKGQNMENKGRRNAAILERELQDDPKDALRIMYLGDAYSDIPGKEAESDDCYRRVLYDSDLRRDHEIVMLRSGFVLLNRLLQNPDPSVEEEYFNIIGILKLWGGEAHPDLDYYLGGWYLRIGDLKRGSGYFERAVKKAEGYMGMESVRLTGNLEFVYCVISKVAAELEHSAQKAVQYSVEALKVNKYSADAIGILLTSFRCEYKEGMNVETYWNFLCKLYDQHSLKDLLFLYRFSEEAGFEKLTERILKEIPEEARQYL